MTTIFNDFCWLNDSYNYDSNIEIDTGIDSDTPLTGGDDEDDEIVDLIT